MELYRRMPPSSAFILPLTAAIVLAGASPAMSACRDVPLKVRLPAQELDERLREITRKTGCSVATADQIPADRRVPAISGRYTAAQLYSRALKNTGFTLKLAGDHFEMHGPANEEPLAPG
jgi:hypothetical protein